MSEHDTAKNVAEAYAERTNQKQQAAMEEIRRLGVEVHLASRRVKEQQCKLQEREEQYKSSDNEIGFLCLESMEKAAADLAEAEARFQWKRMELNKAVGEHAHLFQ